MIIPTKCEVETSLKPLISYWISVKALISRAASYAR